MGSVRFVFLDTWSRWQEFSKNMSVVNVLFPSHVLLPPRHQDINKVPVWAMACASSTVYVCCLDYAVYPCLWGHLFAVLLLFLCMEPCLLIVKLLNCFNCCLLIKFNARFMPSGVTIIHWAASMRKLNFFERLRSKDNLSKC